MNSRARKQRNNQFERNVLQEQEFSDVSDSSEEGIDNEYYDNFNQTRGYERQKETHRLENHFQE